VVLAGQFLERPALVDAQGLVLEGLYHRGRRRPSLLVCPAPGPGAGMDAPVVAELAWAAARAGHASLRFQHRGVGASQGSPDPSRALDDARAALRHLAESARPPLALAGFGAGCETAAALAAEVEGCWALALVAPGRLPAHVPPGVRVLAVLPEQGAGADPRALEAALGPHGRVVVIEGADALFRAGLPRVGRAVVEFLEAEEG
jgi:alpha/beta superfamily hydrolase